MELLLPGVAYGPAPLSADDAAALVGAGVTHVVDLREAWEWQGPGREGPDAVERIAAANVERLHLPTPDGGAPSNDTLDRAVAHIDAALAVGGVVFVHCRAGQERTGAVLLAWLLTRGGDSGQLRELAPALRPLANQRTAVYAWRQARV